MSVDQHPAPPTVADTVVAPFTDPLPKLRLDIDDVKASTDAILTAIHRNQWRNPKRDRSSSPEPSSEAPPKKIEVDCTTAVHAPLELMAGMPFSMKTAKLHAEALTAVAKQLTDALEAEETERPKAIERIDEWAADNEDDFDMENPVHVAALAWFKDNVVFEQHTGYSGHDAGVSHVTLVATVASVRFAFYSWVDHHFGPMYSWVRAAPATETPPHTTRFMGVDPTLPDWRATTVALAARPSQLPIEEVEQAGEAVMTLLPAECPLRDLPAYALAQLLVTTTQLPVIPPFDDWE